MLQQLGELLNLAKLPGHLGAGLAVFVGDAERAKPRRRRSNGIVFGVIVIGGGTIRNGCAGRSMILDFHAEARGPVGLSFELGGLCRGEQVRIEKVMTDQRLD
jgi:hypothetical protein